ncbi:MAG: hypothetical protein RJB66_2034 [Pseudomonadota bacterium]|jgi:tetratricopeptide (TPR) repeat protein
MELTSLESASDILLKNKEIKLANAVSTKGLQLDNHNHKMIYNLGLGSLELGQYKEAKQCFHELLKTEIRFETNYYFAKACEGLNESENAREAYLDAILLPSSNLSLLFEAYKNLGNLYLKEKNFDMAEDFYHKAYSLCPDSAVLLVNLGTLEMQREAFSQAIEKYRKALQVDPRHAPAWVGMALVYQSFGEFDLSWASLLKSLDHDSENQMALLLLAKLSLKQEAAPLAVERLMNHFDKGHFDSQLSLAFIELCIQSNRFNLARLEVERALLWEPNQSDILKFEKALSDHGY